MIREIMKCIKGLNAKMHCMQLKQYYKGHLILIIVDRKIEVIKINEI